MILLRLLSVFLGGLAGAAFLVLAHLLLGLPLLGALGGRAGGTVPPLPAGAADATFLVAAAVGGFTTAWFAPDRPLAHAATLAALAVGLLSVRVVLGPPGGPGTVRILVLPVAVLAGGWAGGRVAGARGRPAARTDGVDGSDTPHPGR